MNAKCKFRCVLNESMPQTTDDEIHLRFEAVTEGSAENDKFFKYTPAGLLDLQIVNSEVASQFKVGKEYYLELAPAIN
jgi:hypothetical protein